MIIAVWGDEKTAKTTFGLTFPKPIKHFDPDLGFYRAAPRFKKEIDAGEITTKEYPIPLQMGVGLKGIRELWEEFQKDYYTAAMDKNVATLVVDSGTQLYEVVRLAFLQERQEAQVKRGMKPNDTLRESLLPVEYAEPFARLDSIYYTAKATRKHLVVTHFSREERADRLNPTTGVIENVTTGKMELDGYKRTARQVDMVLYTYMAPAPRDPKVAGNPRLIPANPKVTEPQESIPWGLVMLSGLELKMVGQRLQEPSYEKVVSLLGMLRGE